LFGGVEFQVPSGPSERLFSRWAQPTPEHGVLGQGFVVCLGQKPRIEPVPRQSIGPRWVGWVASDEFEQWRRMKDKSAEDKRTVANRPTIWG